MVTRRRFLGATAVGLGASLLRGPRIEADVQPATPVAVDDFPWRESSIADMQAAMASGATTARRLVLDHIARIEALDRTGPRVNAIIELNPDAAEIAASLDGERAQGHVRGPLHGIPIVLKDCVSTADRMGTTAGSLALVGATVPRDAGVATRLRAAGAVLLGKANMSEWNAFRGWPLHGGWSARAGMAGTRTT